MSLLAGATVLPMSMFTSELFPTPSNPRMTIFALPPSSSHSWHRDVSLLILVQGVKGIMTCGASSNGKGQKNSETWCLNTGLNTVEETRLRPTESGEEV